MKLPVSAKSRPALMMLVHYDCIGTAYNNRPDEEQPPAQASIIKMFLELALIEPLKRGPRSTPISGEYKTTEAGNLAVKEFVDAFGWLIDGINEKVEAKYVH